jgi:hypothetical protein
MWKKRARSLLSIAAMTTLLTGCNQAVSSCPPLVAYAPSFQKQAARELPAAGANIRVFVTDYSKLRDACRAIQ